MYISYRKKLFAQTLRKERCYPFVLAFISAVLTYQFRKDFVISPSLFSSSVTFGAIVTGFSGTCLAVLIGLESDLMRKIRKTKILIILSEYMSLAMCSGLLFSFLGILGLLLLDNKDVNCSSVKNIIITLWGGGLAFCLACLFRFGHIMLQIFSDPNRS